MATEKVTIVGFGTLLLQESLGDTIGTEKKFRPIVVKDYQRLFNLLPDHYKDYDPDRRLRQDDSELGAANIRPAQGFQFNGLSFEADAANLEQLDARERYYKRAVVPHYDFYTGEDLGSCHVYASPIDARWLCHDTETLLPLWRDIVYARVGAYRIGADFGKQYDETTYLADGKTLLVDYYKDHLEDLEELEAVRALYQK